MPDPRDLPLRCGIYARYSTDLQSAASIDDQVRLCRERAETEGWSVTETFSDRGISGASLLRPGIQALLQAASAGHFDVILAEALDRLSRDQADIAAIYRQLQFAGVGLVTLSEGTISELHIGLKGTMNALFLKDLADKTRRGLRGRVEAGKSGGGNSYGYDVVRSWTPEGDTTRGDRRINADEAAVVQRIFRDYAHGTSPRAIAKALNGEGVPGPFGKTWGPSTIHGNKDRGTGILNNELYIGRLVWNRLRYIKDPATGKRVSRLNPPEAWVVTDMPELRIIDDALWEAVKARQGKVALGKRPDNSSRKQGFWDKRRPRFLLSGLIKCSCCGAGYVKISQHHFGCAGARNKGTCTNTKTIRRETLEASVLDGLQHALMRDVYLEEFCAVYISEINRLRAVRSGDRARHEARLAKIDRELERLVDAIVAGAPAERLRDRMATLEVEQAEIRQKLVAQPASQTPLLHPSLGDLYRNRIASLREVLDNNMSDAAEAVDLLRGLIDRVVITPPETPDATPDILLEGDLAGMLCLTQTSKKAAGLSSDDLMQIKLVAGVGFEPTTFRL